MTGVGAVAEALRLANRTHRLAVECDDVSLGAALEWEARRWQERRTTVVVAGETRRGKTSLINALLRRRQLLPVGVDLATGAQVVVRYASPEWVRVTRRRDDESVGVEEIDLARLADYATSPGDPASRAGVLAIEVGVDDPLLADDLVLVDTPGVGSMTPGDRQSALSAASSADLLVVTLAADEPLLRSELDFLVDAADRVGSVAFVMTRTDLNPDWEDMRREHRDRIRRAAAEIRTGADDSGRHLLRRADVIDLLAEAPMLAVSSRLELRAVGGSSTATRSLAGRSGLAAVRDLLLGLVARRDEVRARNVIRLVDSATRRIETTQSELAAVAANPAAGNGRDIDAEIAALDREMQDSARWRRVVRLGGQRLQSGAIAEVSRRVDAVETAYRDHLIDLSGSELARFSESLPEDLDRAVGALCADLTSWLRERASAEFAELSELVGDATVGAVQVENEILQVITGRAAFSGERQQGQVMEQGMPLVAQSWVWGNMAGAMLGVAVGGWIVLPLGAAVVAPLALLRHRRRGAAQSRQECGRVVRETLAAVRRELSAAMSGLLLELRADLEERIDSALLDRKRTLDLRRQALDALRNEQNETRRRTATSAQRHVEQAREIRAAAEDLRTTLTPLDVGAGAGS